MEPIRVLQVVTIMNRGGLETMLMNYYRKLDRSKIQFDFIVHREERGDYDDEIEALGGKIFRMCPIKPGNYRKYFKELDKFFLEHKEYNVVHSHINENSGFVLRAAKKYNIPCRIAHSHVSGLGFDYKYIFRQYARIILRNKPTHLFACSKEAGKWLFGEEKINTQVSILNNAINLEDFNYNEETRDKLREELGIQDKLVIGHVGRFSPSKNHEFLIDIFNEVYKSNSESVLLLVGTGKVEEEIKNKVKNYNLQDSVVFLGLRSDINKLMNAMDIFVFPSKFEALPVVLIEAQSVGLKCIASTGVPEEVNISNTVDFISLNQDAKHWASRIIYCNKTHKNNTSIIKEKGFDIEDNINYLSKLYMEQYDIPSKERIVR